MAEEKKGVLVYADWIDKFEELSDEEAGKLIKHFFRYVNDLNPTLDDRFLKMAFIDIEKSLKRDLKKWEAIKTKRSEAGKASAEAKRIAKEQQQNQTNSTHVESVKQTSTKSTVNVNDNVSVNVTVNDNVNEINNNSGDDFVCTVDFEQKKELADALITHFGFEEMRFDHHKRTINAFVQKILETGQLENFKEQFVKYHDYKKLSGEKVHNFSGLLGTPAMRFENAAWNSENWQQKIDNFNKSTGPKSKFEKTTDVFADLFNDMKNGNSNL